MMRRTHLQVDQKNVSESNNRYYRCITARKQIVHRDPGQETAYPCQGLWPAHVRYEALIEALRPQNLIRKLSKVI